MGLTNFLHAVEKQSRKNRGVLFFWQADTNLYQTSTGTYTAEEIGELEQRGWKIVIFRWHKPDNGLAIAVEEEPEEDQELVS